MNESVHRFPRFRASARTLRWVFLGLYVMLILGLLSCGLIDDDLFGLSIAALVCLAGQAVFILGAGTRDLCQPIRRRRLVVPVIVAAFMFGLLLWGFWFAMAELFQPAMQGAQMDIPIDDSLWWLFIVGSWVFWGALLFVFALHWERFQFLLRVSTFLLCGSLAQLMATLPAHLVVIRRSGCLVGLMTGVGLTAGVVVLTWSFGPAIVLLFIYPRYRREKAHPLIFCSECGYDLRGSVVAGRRACPECKTPVPPMGS